MGLQVHSMHARQEVVTVAAERISAILNEENYYPNLIPIMPRPCTQHSHRVQLGSTQREPSTWALLRMTWLK